MTEQFTVTIERVDDIPVLVAAMDRMGLADLVDEHFVPHGNWQGLRPGQVLTGWLAHVLSEADHRLNQVQDWATKRIEVLRCYLPGRRILCIVPEARKAEAVERSLLGPITEDCPASILRQTAHAHLFLDAESAARLKK